MLSWEYRDPAEVAERRERERHRKQEQCGNCVHRLSVEWRRQPLDACGKKRAYGWRCWMFEERRV